MKASKNKILKYWNTMKSYMVNNSMNSIEELVRDTIVECDKTLSPTYMVMDSALKIADNINVEKIGYEIYSQVPNGNYRICISHESSSMIVLNKNDKVATVIVLLVKNDPMGMGFNYTSIRVDLEHNCLRVPTQDMDPELTAKNEEFVGNYLKKLVAYIFLSEIELKILPINGKHGNATDPNRIKNDSHTPITMVTNKWNTVTLRVGDFGVSGHFAWRACGTGRSERKLVYIDSYIKHGYQRRG
jgi:hypothetical protein